MLTRLFCPSASAQSLAEISLDDLQARRINFLILDLDNTIAQWQRLEIPDQVVAWIAEARRRGMKLCIASNTRNSRRLNDISARLEVSSVCRALKPRLKGFGEAMKLMGAEKSQTAVIGDQILTDIFGGNRAGLYTILVSPMHPREFIGTKVSRVFEWLLLFLVPQEGFSGNKAGFVAVRKKGAGVKGITGKTSILGVYGCPIGHSLSPAMHNAALREMGLDYIYIPFDVDPLRLEGAVQAIRALGIAGVNVTIPHKERVTAFLDDVSREARVIGSVNTISNRDGRLLGESTDGEGFMGALCAAGAEVKGKRAVVIGAGGSARAVLYALVTNGAFVTVVNRTPERGEELARLINDVTSPGSVRAAPLMPDSLKEAVESADILINCTSVGMWPEIDATPCPEDLLHSRLFVYDLVYNPLSTRLVRDAERAGATAINGLKMLIYQGAASFKTWTGQEPPIDVMEKAALDELASRER